MAAGYLWVEGQYLCYTDASGYKRGQIGTATGATGTAGYLWIQGYNIYYTDANGAVRYLPYYSIGGAGTAGYLWVEGNWVHYINQTTAVKTQWHEDTAHSDWTNSVNHSDWTNSWENHSDYEGCFLAGTKIVMSNGSTKKVENIKRGDRVLSFYGKNQITSAPVLKSFSLPANCYYLIKTKNREVGVTEEHPFYIGKGFKKIKELSIGDKIYALENNKLVPEKIVNKELIKKGVMVYNLSVEESQTYFANKFAVHNKDPWSNYMAYTDSPHSNIAHTDSHSNIAHIDQPALL